MEKVNLVFCLILCSVVVSAGQKIQGDSWAKAKELGKGNITAIYYQSPGLIEKGQVIH